MRALDQFCRLRFAIRRLKLRFLTGWLSSIITTLCVLYIIDEGLAAPSWLSYTLFFHSRPADIGLTRLDCVLQNLCVEPWRNRIRSSKKSRMSVMILIQYVTTSVLPECLSRMCLRLLTWRNWKKRLNVHKFATEWFAGLVRSRSSKTINTCCVSLLQDLWGKFVRRRLC